MQPNKHYYQHILVPWVTDLIQQYGEPITLQDITMPELIEYTEHYLKARGCVSMSVLAAFLEDRLETLTADNMYEHNMRPAYAPDNGERRWMLR